MPPARTDADRLAKSFRRSWMSSKACIAAFDADVAIRQNRRVLGDGANSGTSGWRVDQAPATVAHVVRLIAMNFENNGDPAKHLLPYGVSLGCALTAELLSTVYTDERLAGEVFKIVDESKDKRRHDKQKPLCVLRNTLCHPGYLALGERQPSNVDFLRDVLGDEQGAPLKKSLSASRHAVMEIGLARWAIDRTHELGQFELCRILVERLRTGRVNPTTEDAKRIESYARFRTDMEAVLRRIDSATSVDALVAR